MNWQTFWATIEAIATAGTLLVAIFVLFRELPKIRKEMAARKVDGLKYAREQLESREFQEGRSLIIDVYKTGSDEFPEGISGYIINVMRILDFVAKLIDLGFVDKELLFYLFA